MSRQIDKDLLDASKSGNIDELERLIKEGANVNVKSIDVPGRTPLHLAAAKGHKPVVSLFLANEADANVTDSFGRTPLHLAAEKGHEPVVSLFLDNGADANVTDSFRNTPLSLAADNGHERVVSVLLAHRSDANVTDIHKVTPLHNAAKIGHMPIVAALLSYGADPDVPSNSGRTPLHLAAEKGHEPVVSLFLDNGADANVTDSFRNTPLRLAADNGHERVVSVLLAHRSDANVTDIHKVTPLHNAAKIGHMPIVAALLSYGADPNVPSDWGDTPLHWAAMFGHGPVMSALLSKGADHNIADKEGWTPLHCAAKNGHEPVISALLSEGANPNIADIEGRTAIYYLSESLKETKLHSAARCGSEQAVKKFLKEGFGIDKKNSKEETPLHIAINGGFIKVATILLNHGANWQLTNSKGLTALQESAQKWKETELHSAARLGIDSVISMLIQNKDQVNQKNYEGDTPLQLAVKYGNEPVVSALLSNGADPNIADTEGNTPLHLAAMNGSRNMILTLLKNGALLLETDAKGNNAMELAQKYNNHSVAKLFQSLLESVLDIEDVAFKDLVSQPKILAATLDKISDENLDEHESAESVTTEDTPSGPSAGASCGSYTEKEENQLPRREKQKENPILRWLKIKLGIEKPSISTVDEILAEAVRRGKKGLVDSLLAPIIMMDFGGQTAFYSTHQAFLSYRGIYILVIDGSKGFDEELDTEMFIPGLHGKPTSRKFTLFWVGSIESFSTGTSDSFPKILVVCTHKDKVPKDEADQKANAIFTEIEKMYEGTATMKHLVLEHKLFLNALDPEDPDYDRLKDVLVELVCSQPTWGEKLPKAWIPLKMIINRSVEKGETIMTMTALREVNQENPVQVLSEKDLQLFIKMQHAQGDVIHFPLPGLQENIVISPVFLVDALRSLVTDSRFATGHRNKTVKSMNKNGIIKENDISEIWKANKKVLQHKDYLLPLMEHLDVIAVPRNYDKKGKHVKPDFYYVPSLVKTTDDTNYFQDSDSRVLGLSFKFQSKILPPVIGYRLIASCVDMFEIQSFEGQILLFSGMVVLKVKRGLDIAVFLRPARVDIFLIHANSRFQIIRDTASGIAECLKDILSSIFENYKVTSFETKNKSGMPYTIEYPCFDCLSPCYSEDTNDGICDHGYNITKVVKDNWKTDRKVVNCPKDCEGLNGRELDELPTDLHLSKLAQQFNWEDLYRLVIRLGLTVSEVKAIQDDYGINLLNVAFLCLRKWRLKAKGTVGHLITAIKDMDLDIHAACKMLRHRPMDEIDVSMEEPTDQLLDSIASEAITESLFLSIELGHNASLWLQMKDDKEKIVKINRKILAEWRSEHPRKDQMKDLAQALCNVGLNISTFVEIKANE